MLIHKVFLTELPAFQYMPWPFPIRSYVWLARWNPHRRIHSEIHKSLSDDLYIKLLSNFFHSQTFSVVVFRYFKTSYFPPQVFWFPEGLLCCVDFSVLYEQTADDDFGAKNVNWNPSTSFQGELDDFFPSPISASPVLIHFLLDPFDVGVCEQAAW